MAQKTRSSEFAGGFPESIKSFELLVDPRQGKAKRHYFGEIIFIALAAMIANCEGFADIEIFAKSKESWLRKFLKLPNGIPSDDTFRRTFAAIDPKQFNQCFIDFVSEIQPNLSKQLIAIDGKTLRHSFDKLQKQDPIHIVSAWACDAGISLAQLRTDKKSNEITAIPKLLKQLDIEGQTVSLDAMGCQKKIAQEIHFAKADYLLALKSNHGNLYKQVAGFFRDTYFIRQEAAKGRTFTHDDVSERAHGRLERRTLLATDAIDWIDENERKHWLGLKSLICVEEHRKVGSDDTSVNRRYYLSSLPPEAKELQKLVKQHWSIENQCHWVLDVVWREDDSRIRKGKAAENFALLRKMALNLLKTEKSVSGSIRSKRLRASFNDDILEKFLKIKNSK